MKNAEKLTEITEELFKVAGNNIAKTIGYLELIKFGFLAEGSMDWLKEELQTHI